jgi:hypothetical protein
MGVFVITPAGFFSHVFGAPTFALATAIVSLFHNVVLVSHNSFMISGQLIELIPACIAGSAYFLLTLLNLTTPMGREKRIYSLIYLYAGFLVLNVVRIAVFSLILVSGAPFFDFLHLATWYVGSTVFVIGLWFSQMHVFKISDIPVYTDLQRLVRMR